LLSTKEVYLMDLDEYLFYRKQKDPHFTHAEFAKKLGVGKVHFCGIVRKKRSPTAIAYKLWKESEGKIDIGKLIIDYFMEQEKSVK